MGNEVDDGFQIAVVGLAGRFPGARDVAAFWKNLCAGIESVKRFTDEELRAVGEPADLIADPAYVKACPALDDIDMFDAGFFGWSPLDASVTDPQHRVFLETAWQTFEDAGYDPGRYDGPIGVFASSGMPAYMMHHLVTNRALVAQMGEWLIRHTGNDMNFLATRVSYELDLRGPSLNVQTACSSALVAIHLAAQSLLLNECDMALAGASAIQLPQDRGYIARDGEILSRDGHCRPFDENASGTLFGGGAGCVLLKRVADAVVDGDRVLAVIRGSAINNDGAGKVGYLSPSVGGQASVISEALAVARLTADQVGLVEAHGTGTIIGDPIEVRALTQAFRESTDRRGFCALGSVKANIGHLGEAAGMAAFIKTVLALHHRQIPPHINYQRPNVELDLTESPFTIHTVLKPWVSSVPRIAGVTALGAGGTNAHVLLAEAPAAPEPPAAPRPSELLLLSARTASALERSTADLADHLAKNSRTNLADVAFTLALGRAQFAHRRIAVGTTASELVAALEDRTANRTFAAEAIGSVPPVVFMFAGGGAQHAGMADELYRHEPRFRAIIDQGVAHLRVTAGLDLLPLLYPPSSDVAAAGKRLESPSVALPALFVTQYALASLLLAWGVKTDALVGHSMGEYVAACLAGVLSYEDALSLVTVRGRLFERVPPGGMLSVRLAESELAPLLDEGRRSGAWPDLSIAAVNAPDLCVVSGASEAIAALAASLTAREVDTQRIHISVPAHSKMLDPILAEFTRYCRTVAFGPPRHRYISNLTGGWITAAETTNPQYWADHLRHTVRFSAGLTTLSADPKRLLLEVGPGRTLTRLARAQLGPGTLTFPTLPHPDEAEPALAFFQTSVGRMWAQGVEFDWKSVYDGDGPSRRRRVPLPTYPFERTHHWIPRPSPGVAEPTANVTAAAPGVARGTEAYRLERRPDSAGRSTFTVDLQRDRHWLIGEHAVRGGEALIPGTGFLELARAVGTADGPCPAGHAVELRDMVFLAPFVVKSGTRRVLRIVLDARDGQIAFSGDRADADAKAGDGRDGDADPFVTGFVRVVATAAPPPVDVASIRSRCPNESRLAGHYLDQSFMDFGPRWANLVRIGYGQREAFLELALPAAFTDDLASFPLHPALLDMATGGAQALITGFDPARDFFVPFSYGRVLIRKALEPRVLSHVRHRPAHDANTAIFDITVFDERGNELVRIEDFIMKRGQGVLVAGPADRPPSTERRSDVGDWFYRPVWRAIPSVTAASGVSPDTAAPVSAQEAANVLLFCDRAGLGHALGAELTSRGRKIVNVFPGTAFSRSAEDEFTIDVRRPEDYQLLLRTLDEGKRTPSAIVHLWLADAGGDGTDPAAVTRTQDLGFFSLLHLAQAIGAEDLSKAIRLTVVSTETVQVAGEAVSPVKATVLGPIRVIPREFPNIACRFVDVGRARAGSFLEARTRRALANEIEGLAGADPIVAYRGADRWVQTFEPVHLDGAAASPRLRKGGVYLITGGLGGLGLLIAEHLARGFGARLALMSRNGLPDPATWDAWLEQHDAADPSARCIRKVRELEALGADVSIVAADVSRPAEVKRVVDETRRRFGGLNGVFHTAGVLDDGVIALKKRSSAEAVLAPKVAGTLALDAALAGQDLDFLLLFSSISALCGLTGQVDYAAANAFLDAYAQDRLSRDGDLTLSVNWSGWREVGLAAELGRRLGVVASDTKPGSVPPTLANNLIEVTFRDGILPTEGMEALDRLLAAGPLPQVIVSPTPLAQLFAKLSAPPPPVGGAAATRPSNAAPKGPGRDLSRLEAALAEHEAVAEAAASELEERPGERRIVAYVVYRPGELCTVSELRRFLRGKVTEDLVPRTFIDLDRLPRVVSGDGLGVDRAALPNPFGSIAEAAGPTTPVEIAIADLWRELLGVKQVGIRDNFFDVGGHSLLSVRFIARVHKQLGVRLQHADVVASTLQQLASKCTAAMTAAGTIELTT